MVDYNLIKEAAYGTLITLGGAGLIGAVNYFSGRWSNNHTSEGGVSPRKGLSEKVKESDQSNEVIN